MSWQWYKAARSNAKIFSAVLMIGSATAFSLSIVSQTPRLRRLHKLNDDTPTSKNNIISRLKGRTHVHCEASIQETTETAHQSVHEHLEAQGYIKLDLSNNGLPDRFTVNHAIYGQLLGEGRIQRYDIYENKNLSAVIQSLDNNTGNSTVVYKNEPIELITALIDFGHQVNGWDGVVHGGIAALIFDDAMGFGADTVSQLLFGGRQAFTANLNVDFRSILLQGESCKVKVVMKQLEGRKIYLSAKLTSLDGTVLYSEATSLYIVARESY